MIKMPVSCDLCEVGVEDSIYRICAQYGSAGAGYDNWTIVCGEDTAAIAQKIIDGKTLRLYRLRHIVLPPEMLPRNCWAIVRDGNHGCWSEGA